MSDVKAKGTTKATPAKTTRCIAVVGPQSSGKTTLIESMLLAAGAILKKGQVQAGTTVSDTSPEARARQMSTDLTPVRFSYLGDDWVAIDCPGAVDLMQDAHQAMLASDAVIVVTDPDADRMLALGPIFRFLDHHKIPHILFINKMDTVSGLVRDLIAAAQKQSSRPLVLRHIPLQRSGKITGYVDLVAERAYHYELDKPSELIPIEKFSDDSVPDSRRALIEKLSDFDDALLEKLLEDVIPDKKEVYRHLTKDLQEDLIVPVLIGAAAHEHGVRRLMKALRHEVPQPARTAERLQIPDGPLVAQIYKIQYVPHLGKLSLMRIWRGTLKDGDDLAGIRVGSIQDGAEPRLAKAKLHNAGAGNVVALSKLEAGRAGTILTDSGTADPKVWVTPPIPLHTVAVIAKDRKDDVKLGEALRKICEEDPSLTLEHVAETAEMLLRGQGDVHLQIALDRVKRKFDLVVDTRVPQVPYRETIRKGVTQHARHKRQSGGHGQFADIKVEIKPLPRGSGFTFTDAIVGGVVPRNFIPGVEAGLRDNIAQGPLGFPVVDVAVKLFDGQYHSVDSSDQAFRTAGRLAMTEGLPQCEPVLLEPICEVSIYVPSEFTSKVQRAVTQRRAQILGFNAREGWDGWDMIQVNMPESEMRNLITEIRSISQGIGTFESKFSHYQELTGRDAEKITHLRKQGAAAHH
ncbi:MAG: elongation factor G [Rhodospirillaceae bacterium]|nr:elongation factor G [Rhodospirillaceae bacterium]